jgi:hypothetical protein
MPSSAPSSSHTNNPEPASNRRPKKPSNKGVSITTVRLPEFGDAASIPEIPVSEYRSRLLATVRRMKTARLDILVVYADREHSANLKYLTGCDPRFEEAMLLLDVKGQRLLVVGNECLGYLPDKAINLQIELFQFFSLLGQPRDASRPLKTLLGAFGVGWGKRVGCVGWKYYDKRMTDSPALAIELPAFLVDALRELIGRKGLVVNATALFMDADKGMRLECSAAQLAHFEYAAVKASQSVLRAIRNLAPGASEKGIASSFDSGGLTLSCHPMVSFGEKARRGLSSPSDRPAKIGDAFTLAFGVEGSLTSRAGILAQSAEDLPKPLRDFYPAFCKNYFEVLSTWYQSLRVGALAGDIFQAVERVRNPRLFDFALNPGHYIHLDEWVHSPFEKQSRVRLRSGMALQADIIPVSKGPFCAMNGEDGVALADAALQKRLRADYPEVWERIQKRKTFMRETLGIRLHETVLPLSNTAGWVPQYGFSPDQILVRG